MSDIPSQLIPRTRSEIPARDVEGFFLAVREAQQDLFARYKIDPATQPLFVEEWPKERLSKPDKAFDFIGFHVVFSRRASESNTSYRAPTGLKLFNEQPSDTETGYMQQDFGFTEEAIVQFTIFSQSNRRASAVMSWLRALILAYGHLNWFKNRGGFHQVIFHNRLEDTIEKTQDQDLYTRRIQFKIRAQNLFNLEAKTLETFRIDASLKGGSEVISKTIVADYAG